MSIDHTEVPSRAYCWTCMRWAEGVCLGNAGHVLEEGTWAASSSQSRTTAVAGSTLDSLPTAITALMEQAAQVCNVPAHRVMVSFHLDREEVPEGELVYGISVSIDRMIGRGVNRRRAKVWGSGTSEQAALADLAESFLRQNT